MSATDRQNRLLVAEDWKRIYQSFRNADFQSYDFENLRRVMINYIRTNYPEDFNDYIESSEYLALIDLIAFLGQNIAFRVDLNARDNFLELAERRDSILRLARLLSYPVKRNLPASGLLKFTTVSTTQTVADSNGRNLAGQSITWNDPANPNWYDQFIKVLNSALPFSEQFGSPADARTVFGIPTEQYRFQSINSDVPVYSFTKSVDGRSMSFEVVSTTFENKNEIYEEPPKLGNRMAFVYRNDGKGNGSSNTGFFLHFKQGVLNQGTFTLTQPAPDESVDIDAVNINNTDVWLYQLDKNSNESDLWNPVPDFKSNNVIYNSISKDIRNIYGVVTRNNDRISLTFGDGLFGNLPQGTFRVYYRTSNALSYTINPKDLKNIAITIPYVSNLGQVETLTITLSLSYAVSNSSPSETNESIQVNAPSSYYTQNRMITAEDYNIAPLSVNQEVVKIKAVNRSSSGISRYFDIVDPTGKYSKTNLFGDDGVLYRQFYKDSIRFKYTTRSDIEAIVYNQIFNILKTDNLRNFYYSKYSTVSVIGTQWEQQTIDINQSTGSLSSSQINPYFTVGALVKFIAPSGYYFDRSDNNSLVLGTANVKDSSNEIWCKVVSILGSGTEESLQGDGPIVLNDIVPDGAELSEIIPVWRPTLDTPTVSSIVDLIFSNKPFGLRYDTESRSWKIIFENNLNVLSDFSLGRQGDTSNQKVDSSWLLLFTTDTEFYTVEYRQVRYVFESEQQVRFYYDSSDKIYDAKNNQIVKDKIKFLSVNTLPINETRSYNYDLDWEIVEEYKGSDGYIDSKKISISFFDSDDDGVIDDPMLFEKIVNPSDSPESKFVIFEKYKISQGQEDYRYVKNTGQVIIVKTQNDADILRSETPNDQYFYIIEKDLMLVKTEIGYEITDRYRAFSGRDRIRFQYIHNADYESRIDPGITNLIDVYVLTKQYDIEYRQWVNGSISEKPLPPSSDYLFNTMSPSLNKIKSISDEIVYFPVKYKVLFGSKASSEVQATFKVVKNLETVASDNDIKVRVLRAISEFFALENWDFGDSFYFSELNAYVMNKVSPFIVNFVIVSKQSDLSFGSLFEIRSEKDEIFINGAGIDDIEIISSVTASNIKAAGNIEYKNNIISTQQINSSRRV